MKKVISILMVFAISLAFSACGQNENNVPTNTAESPSQTTSIPDDGEQHITEPEVVIETPVIGIGETATGSSFDITFLDFFTVKHTHMETATNGFTFAVMPLELTNHTNTDFNEAVKNLASFYADNVACDVALNLSYSNGYLDVNGYKSFGFDISVPAGRSARGFIACEIPENCEIIEAEFDGIILKCQVHPQAISKDKADHVFSLLSAYAKEGNISNKDNIYTTILKEYKTSENKDGSVMLSYHTDEECLYLINTYDVSVRGGSSAPAYSFIKLDKNITVPYSGEFYGYYDGGYYAEATFNIYPASFNRDAVISSSTLTEGQEEPVSQLYHDAMILMLETLNESALKENGLTYANIGFLNYQ